MQHPVLHLYTHFTLTLARLRHRKTTTRVLLEPLLSSLDHFVQSTYVYLTILPFQVAVNHTVQLTQNLTQLRVKVVFYTVISSELINHDLPGIFWAIRDHLLPISL